MSVCTLSMLATVFIKLNLSKFYLLLTTVVLILMTSTPVVAYEKKSHHNFPPAVTDFHDVLAPLWHSAPGQGRAKRSCLQYGELLIKVDKIYVDKTPDEVNKVDWKSATDKLKQQILSIKSACESGRSPEAALSNMHNAYYELVRLLGHRH